MDSIKGYFSELKALLQIEKEVEIDRKRSYFDKTSLKEQKADGVTWHPINIKENDYGLGDYPFLVIERTSLQGSSHQFKPGQTVGVFTSKSDERPVKGLINYISNDEMKIIFHIDELPDWLDDGGIGIQLLFDERSFKEMEVSMNYFMNLEDRDALHLTKVILGETSRTNIDQHVIEIPSLNPSQNDAVNDIISSKDISVVHGPPGTGKTTTLVEAIFQLAKKEKHILVTAPSNAATDFLTKKLTEKGMSVTRIGNLARVDEETVSHTLDYQVANNKENKRIKTLKKQANEYRRMASKYKRKFGKEERDQRRLLYQEARNITKEIITIEDDIIEKIIGSSQVITTTLVGSKSHYLKNILFDTVVIDEAGQALEPACWIPISKSKKVVLAGDPLQLPPTVKSEEAAKKGLSNTLIEKCINKLESSLLDTQYRMNEEIMAFSNSQFYKEKLKADDSVKKIKLGADEFPVIEFIDTAGCGFDEESQVDSKGLSNPEEAQLVFKHLKPLMEQNNNASVGIISPYRNQVNVLQEILGTATENITINTVDSFQGQERDVIYISLVRSNTEGNIGFLKDYRRMNVAMTRAKKKLVIIGDSATLANDKFYSKFMDFVENNSYYRSAWEFVGEV